MGSRPWRNVPARRFQILAGRVIPEEARDFTNSLDKYAKSLGYDLNQPSMGA
jgi:hypothetical protein